MMMLMARGCTATTIASELFPSSLRFSGASYLFCFAGPLKLLYYFHSTMFVVFHLRLKTLRSDFIRSSILHTEKVRRRCTRRRLKKLKTRRFLLVIGIEAGTGERKKIVRCITSNHHSIDLWCSRMTCASFFCPLFAFFIQQAHHELNEKTCSQIGAGGTTTAKSSTISSHSSASCGNGQGEQQNNSRDFNKKVFNYFLL